MLAFNRYPTACNYVTTSPGPQGIAYSPAFPLTGQGPHTITIKYRRDVNGGDTTFVQVKDLTDGSVNIPTLSPPVTNSVTPVTSSGTISSTVNPGHVARLEIHFIADVSGNLGFGWMLDELTVTSAGPSAWNDQGGALVGSAGPPVLVGTGTLAPGSTNGLHLSNAAPSALSAVFYGLGGGAAPFKGGVLQPSPPLGPVFLVTKATGWLDVPFTMTAGVPPGTELWVQWAVQDAGALAGVALSNAIRGLTP